jgi:hypothetical protein
MAQGESIMHRTIRTFIALLGATALSVVASVAFAKGPPAQVTITGPNIDGEIVITDPSILDFFSFYRFNDLGRRIDAPESYGIGYTITRYVEDGDKMKAWDTLTYYPDPEGGLGWLYFNGLMPSIGTTEGQEQWYAPTEQSAAILRGILTPNAAAQSLRRGRGQISEWGRFRHLPR